MQTELQMLDYILSVCISDVAITRICTLRQMLSVYTTKWNIFVLKHINSYLHSVCKRYISSIQMKMIHKIEKHKARNYNFFNVLFFCSIVWCIKIFCWFICTLHTLLHIEWQKRLKTHMSIHVENITTLKKQTKIVWHCLCVV